MGKIRSQHGTARGKTLSPESLAREFGVKAEVARSGVRTLYKAFVAAENLDVAGAFRCWKTRLGNACGHDLGRTTAKVRKLASCYDVPAAGLKPDAILFALHTYYALLVKLLVGQVMAFSRGLPGPAARLLQADAGRRMRRVMQRLDSGEIFRELNVADPFRGDPFSWYAAEWSAPIEGLIRRLAATMAEYDPDTLTDDATGGRDLLKELYQGLFPRSLRHQLGEYYTPDWLADHVLEQAGYSGDPNRRLLDPACGSGTFLVAAIGRVRAWYEANLERGSCRPDKAALCGKILEGVVGFDLNPLAVMAARANYLIAVRDLLPHAGQVEIPVVLCDSILDGPESVGQPQPPFDYVVGNPPWIAWDNLPDEYRRATKPLWERYGLFTLSGNEGRHGGAKKDVSALMLHTAADRYLKDGGRLAMVVTQTLFQTKGAGDGFRRFRLGPDGQHLKVLRVDDMVALRPFEDAANFTATIVLEKGAPTQYPVPYVKWSPDDGGFRKRSCQAQPINPARPGSPWFVRPEGFTADLARLVGPSDYRAYLGANSGGANGVYWVNIAGESRDDVLVRNIAGKSKQTVEAVEQTIEPGLLYPLLRWADVSRYRARPSAHVLLAQDVVTRTGIDRAVMQHEYPRTYAYLKRFERMLTARAAYRRYQASKVFYSMYNVGRYTVAPIKVVWRRMDRRINAAVVRQVDDLILGPRPVIPQETCVLIPCETASEAHYACAVLNSSIVHFLVTAHSVGGGKGFGTPGMLDFIKLPRFDAADQRHDRLATFSREAHQAVDAGRDPAETQRRIDRLAGELWGLAHEELEAIDAL